MDCESEFGSGIIYPIALFLCHSERDEIRCKHKFISEDSQARSWFYSAGDHLFELRTDIQLNLELNTKINQLRCFVLNRRLGETKCEKSDIQKAVNMAKGIMFELDKHFGHSPIKAGWE